MRGLDNQQGHVFSTLSPEQRVRKDHPPRAVRAMTDEILRDLSALFDQHVCANMSAVGCSGKALAGAVCYSCCIRCVPSGC
jgi:hypothetical protein